LAVVNELNPFAPPVHDEPRPDRTITAQAVPFFLVSRTKLAVMWLSTLGLYQVYWFYRHWKLTKLRTRSDIWPLPRAIFALFFTHSLLRSVRLAAAEADVEPSFKVQASAWGFIVLSLLHRLPDPYWLVTMLSFVPLLPVQHTINETQRRNAPTADMNSGFTLANWVVIAIGLVFWALVFVGLFVPEEAFSE
jgi:hypothetical protein